VFRDNPESITTESSASTTVALSLRRSPKCTTLKGCAAKHRKALWACYGDATSQEDVIDCERAAESSCEH
jgi:hypothetical protein